MTNSTKYLTYVDIKSAPEKEWIALSKKLASKVDKKLFITLGMNPVKNSLIYNNETYLVAENEDNVFRSPQLNDITFKFPPYPMIYQPKPLPEVKLMPKYFKFNKLFIK